MTIRTLASVGLALILFALSITAADARCWGGETVSWYTDRHTASGEPYTYKESTCAHPTAKFGTKFRVTDNRTKKSVTCRVNDRGPNKWTKCKLDVNEHAAQKLAMKKRGVIHAKIEAVKETAHAPLVQKARAYLGTNPTGWKRLWCAKFIAMLRPDLARKVDNPNWARDWAALPKAQPKVGVIVVLSRGNAGHIGVLTGFDRHGNPRIISGNHGNRVAESVYPKSRVIAYVAG